MKVAWTPHALAVWFDLPMREAEHVDAAVQRFAAGLSEPGPPRRVRLRVGQITVLLSLDGEMVHVTRLFV